VWIVIGPSLGRVVAPLRKAVMRVLYLLVTAAMFRLVSEHTPAAAAVDWVCTHVGGVEHVSMAAQVAWDYATAWTVDVAMRAGQWLQPAMALFASDTNRTAS
jgi:hypothetical protein